MLEKTHNNLTVLDDALIIKGTDPTSVDDLVTDAELAVGYYSHRFYDAEKVLKENPQITTVGGHSLGGSVAIWLADRHPGLKAVALNPGITYDNFDASRRENVRVYRTPLDPVSIGSVVIAAQKHRFPNTYNVWQRGLDPHGLSNFDDLDDGGD